MRSLTNSEYEYIIRRIVVNAMNAINESADKKNEYTSGYKVANYEILDIVKSELEARDADVKGFGLDFTIESLI